MTVVVLWVSGNFSVVGREDLKYKTLKKYTQKASLRGSIGDMWKTVF
jgi:hypothetical protein